MISPVLIEKVPDYSIEPLEQFIRRSLDYLYPSHSPFQKGKKVLIKPNLLAPKLPEEAVTTHPAVVEALVRVLKDTGVDMYIGDNTPIFNQSHTIRKTQLGSLLKKYGISHYRFQKFETVSEKSSRFQFQIPRDFDQFQFIINVPKLKTHTMMLTTLCVKNMYGCLSTPQRIHYHFQADVEKTFFARMLLDLYTLFSSPLNILDGIIMHEGNGPSSGTPRPMGLIAVSPNGIALDYSINKAFQFSYSNPLNEVIESDYKEYLQDISFPWLKPEDFPLNTVKPPEHYEGSSLAFRRGLIKHVYQYLCMSRPRIDKAICTNCRHCIRHCPVKAISSERKINYWRCIRCYCCQELCPYHAVMVKKPYIPYFE